MDNDEVKLAVAPCGSSEKNYHTVLPQASPHHLKTPWKATEIISQWILFGIGPTPVMLSIFNTELNTIWNLNILNEFKLNVTLRLAKLILFLHWALNIGIEFLNQTWPLCKFKFQLILGVNHPYKWICLNIMFVRKRTLFYKFHFKTNRIKSKLISTIFS